MIAEIQIYVVNKIKESFRPLESDELHGDEGIFV